MIVEKDTVMIQMVNSLIAGQICLKLHLSWTTANLIILSKNLGTQELLTFQWSVDLNDTDNICKPWRILEIKNFIIFEYKLLSMGNVEDVLCSSLASVFFTTLINASLNLLVYCRGHLWKSKLLAIGLQTSYMWWWSFSFSISIVCHR